MIREHKTVAIDNLAWRCLYRRAKHWRIEGEAVKFIAQIVEMIGWLNYMDLREDNRLVFKETRSGWHARAA